MKRFEIPEAELEFFTLIDEVENGASILITRNGVPAAKLVPVDSELPKLEVEGRD